MRGPLVAFVFGIAVFAARGGAAVADPRDAAWMSGDVAWHHLGWLFYRAEAWTWPLGRTAHFPEPVGTAIGFVDAVPLAALLFKALDPLLPAGFQYLGPWLALSFGLQAFFGARIASLYSGSPVTQALGGAVFAVAPPLLERMGHVALASHWLLLAALEVALDPRSPRWRALAVVGVAAGVHPYLLAMAFALCAPRLGLAGIAGAGLLVALEGWAFGYLDGADWAVDGWGRYGADVLALVNPMARSRLPVGWDAEAEGFAWLGPGVLLAVPLAARPPRRVAAVCVLLAAFSISDQVRVGGRQVLSGDFDWFGFGGPFQTSGRFVWPLHYLVVAAAIAGVCRFRHGGLALAVVLALQVADRPVWRWDPGPPTHHLRAPAWDLAVGSYRHLALDPPQLGCCPSEDRIDPVPFGYLAARLGLTVDSARLARDRCAAEVAYCASPVREADTVWVLGPSRRGRRPDLTCGRLDGWEVCVQRGRDDAFARALR
ncbi:MAG: DUF6311 domain-containing protein [Myxococcota bacterium]